MLDILLNPDVWVAVISGGVLVKIIDYLFPAILNRRENNEEFSMSEKSNLRKDIEYLRSEIDELRKEVDKLKGQIENRDKEISKWQRLYWRKKLELDKVVWEIKHYGEEAVVDKVLEAISDETKGETESF